DGHRLTIIFGKCDFCFYCDRIGAATNTGQKNLRRIGRLKVSEVIKKPRAEDCASAPASRRKPTSISGPLAVRTEPETTGRIAPSSQSIHFPLTRIDAAPHFAKDVAHVWHFVRVFLAGEAFYFFRGVCYEQLPTSSGNIPTPMSLENLKLFGMFTQPGHVALSLLDQARHLWCRWV